MGGLDAYCVTRGDLFSRPLWLPRRRRRKISLPRKESGSPRRNRLALKIQLPCWPPSAKEYFIRKMPNRILLVKDSAASAAHPSAQKHQRPARFGIDGHMQAAQFYFSCLFKDRFWPISAVQCTAVIDPKQPFTGFT